MARNTLPRTKTGRYESAPNGIREFANKVANELVSEFKNVDFFDLKMCFESEFNFAYTMAMMKETEDIEE